MEDHTLQAIIDAAYMLKEGCADAAGEIIISRYPFVPTQKKRRKISLQKSLKQFFADGWTDRYFGTPLVHPGLLRLLSAALGDVFPYHSHWKYEACHRAYWEYQPTVDHVIPLALGGKDGPENWLTTSMLHNMIKNSFTLEQLGWRIVEAGDIRAWDGLSHLFLELVERDSTLLAIPHISALYAATKKFCL